MPSSIQLSPGFISVLTLLNANQVEYLVVGGFAVQYFGYQRPTTDLDIWIASHPQNAAKALRVCQLLGGGVTDLPVEAFRHPNRIIRIELPPAIITVLDPIIGQSPTVLHRSTGGQGAQTEILTVQSGLDFETAFARRVSDMFDGVEIQVISLQDLLTIKQAGGRSKDLDDVVHLQRIAQARTAGA